MFPDSRRPRRLPGGTWRCSALVYHRSCDGDHSDNSTRSSAAPGRPRPQDARATGGSSPCSPSSAAALSLVFAMMRPKNYQSWATLFYQERIQSSLLLEPRGASRSATSATSTASCCSRARSSSRSSTIRSSTRFPTRTTRASRSTSSARRQLEARGGNAFRIIYTDADPDRAKAVTEKLTKLLQEKDESLRNETRRATPSSSRPSRRRKRPSSCAKHEQALAEFLAKHPEFAQDHQATGAAVAGEGASIRARRTKKPNEPENARLYALERQRQRIQARLNAPPDAPPVRIQAPPRPRSSRPRRASPRRSASSRRANRELEDALDKYTDQHPTVIERAGARCTAAQAELRARRPRCRPTSRPRRAGDRGGSREAAAGARRLEEQIATEQKRGRQDARPASTRRPTGRRARDRARRAAPPRQRAARARRVARRQRVPRADRREPEARRGGRPAHRRRSGVQAGQAVGPGKTIFLIAGMVLFLALGFGLALGLAVIDDRLYRRADLEELGSGVGGDSARASQFLKEPKRSFANDQADRTCPASSTVADGDATDGRRFRISRRRAPTTRSRGFVRH